MNIVKKLLPFLLIPAFFALGLFAGPKIAGLYYELFPEPQYTTGDHRELYAKAGHPVVLYATTTCPYCAKVRKLFAEKGVVYTEYQIDKSQDANRDFLAKGGVGVPLLYIGERRIDGYREQAIIDAVAAVSR